MYEKFKERKPYALLDTSKYPPEVAGRFNSFITTQFDDSLTTEMQMRSIIKWAIDNFKTMDETYNDFTEHIIGGSINPFIEFLNDLIEYMNEFVDTFDTKFQEEILKNLQEWYNDGTLETLINESLDTKYNEMDNRLTAQLTQSDYLEFHEKNLVQGKNLFKMNGDRNVTFIFEVGESSNHYNSQYTGYRFEKDPTDDFIKLREVTIHEENETGFGNYQVDSGNVSGSTTSNSYTTEVDTTLSHDFEGTGIDFQHYFDDQGGIFDVFIDGSFVKTVSTHIESIPENEIADLSGNRRARRIIARGLNEGKHNIKLVFKGADPNHPPENSPARGWLKQNLGSGSPASATFRTYNISPTYELLDNASNKEFAFSSSSGWLPEHNGVGTVFLGDNGTQEIFIDGEKMQTLPLNKWKKFSVGEIYQLLEAKYPSESTPTANIVMSTQIVNNKITYLTKFKFNKSRNFVSGYVNMLPSSTSDFASRLNTSSGNTFQNSNAGSDIELDEESKQYVFTGIQGSSVSDFYVGVSFVDWATSRRLKEDGSGDTFLQHRTDGLQKLYPKVFENYTVSEGEIFKFGGTFFAGKIRGASRLLTND